MWSPETCRVLGFIPVRGNGIVIVHHDAAVLNISCQFLSQSDRGKADVFSPGTVAKKSENSSLAFSQPASCQNDPALKYTSEAVHPRYLILLYNLSIHNHDLHRIYAWITVKPSPSFYCIFLRLRADLSLSLSFPDQKHSFPAGPGPPRNRNRRS